jgi:hypothetical protein
LSRSVRLYPLNNCRDLAICIQADRGQGPTEATTQTRRVRAR